MAIDTSKLSEEPFTEQDHYVPVLLEEPRLFDGDMAALDHLIVGAAMRGASDLTFSTGARTRVQINGRQRVGLRRPTSATEMNAILAHLWNAEDAPSLLRQGRALDFSYEVRIARGKRQRYRINAVGIMRGNADGIELTLRALPETTPTLDQVAFEPELRPYTDPKSGMIVIAGATGQGKSTTMAALTRAQIERGADGYDARKIVDFSAPIEFDYADLFDETSTNASIIGQSEIGPGRNLPTFADGIRSAMRRAPQIINVGESRDLETMSASIEACLTGHLVQTTTHAGSVAEALRRMASVFSVEEREGRAFDLITSLQMCVVQHLIRTSDGQGRVAVREYLVFDDDVRARFTSSRVDDWPAVVAALMETPGDHLARPLKDHARMLLSDGRISERDAARFIPRELRAA